MNMSVNVNDLTNGKRVECKDIVEMLAVEDQIKEAWLGFQDAIKAGDGNKIWELLDAPSRATAEKFTRSYKARYAKADDAASLAPVVERFNALFLHYQFPYRGARRRAPYAPKACHSEDAAAIVPEAGAGG